MEADFSKFGPFLIAALTVFVIYRRLRRSFGQQQLRRVRMQVRIVVLLIAGCLLLPVAWRSTEFLSAVLAGVAAGVALALWGAARTRFLKIDHQLYYVPHTYTGIAVSLLFLGRLSIGCPGCTAARPRPSRGADSGGPGICIGKHAAKSADARLFFVLMGYYVCYYSVVLWKSKRVLRKRSVPVRRFRPVNWKNAPERVPNYLKVMTTAYVISRNVNNKALLPHRDTNSTMTAFSTLYRAATLHFRRAEVAAAGLKTRQ